MWTIIACFSWLSDDNAQILGLAEYVLPDDPIKTSVARRINGFLSELSKNDGIIGLTRADVVTIADYRTKCGNIMDLSLKTRIIFSDSALDISYNSGYSILYDEEKESRKRLIRIGK